MKHRKSFSNIIRLQKKTLGAFACLLLTSFPMTASCGTDSISYLTEARATFSGGKYTPFWLVSNLQGLGSPEKDNGWVRAAVFKDIDSSQRFSWGAGVDLVASWNSNAPFSIHQLYGELKYRSLGVLVGSKEMWCDYNNPKLSSGSLLFSGNALPIPQVRVGIPEFTPFWGTKGWFSVKGYIAYGMFTDSKWQKSWAAPDSKRTEDVLFHSKGLWIRGGNTDRFPLTAEVGIEMATQFGGVSYEDGKVVNMKPKLKDWLNAFFPTKDTQEGFDGKVTSIQGNMLGQYTIALAWQPKKDWSIRGYFEHYFEDQSQMTFEYGWKDGLWGLDIEFPENRFVSEFVYEFLYTKDQTGPVYNDSSNHVPEQVSGRDSYYNHALYTGWQHWGMGIGNPLLLSPIYNSNHEFTFYDNRIIGHHFAVAGSPVKDIDYRMLLSFSKNWGTYKYPLPEVLNNFNSLIEVSWHPEKFKGWYGSVGVACNAGNLLGKSFGCSITIGKSGNFSLSKKHKR